jgi:amidophosphoribosyltransferase
LVGNAGIGQVRYPTAGSASSEEEAQPFYVSAPYGIILAHNGNLTNAPSLRVEMAYRDRRHINTSSDTEVLLNVLADELQKETNSAALDEGAMFNAVTGVTSRVKGSYAVVSLIAGYGLLAFRDQYGIRPLCIGRIDTPQGPEWMIASESVALEGLGFTFVRDVNPGEAIYIDLLLVSLSMSTWLVQTPLSMVSLCITCVCAWAITWLRRFAKRPMLTRSMW